MSKGSHIQTYSKRILAMLMLLMIAGGWLNGQTTVTISENMACENSELLVPVDVTGFENVAAFTFFIQIDTLAVEFVELVNTHANLSGGSIIANFMVNTSRIGITWSSISGATIPNGKLFDLKMEYHQGVAALQFDDNGELANPDGTVLENVSYQDGTLLPALIVVEQPQPVTVTEGEQAAFGIELQFAGAQQYQWQQELDGEWTDIADGDHFSGANAALLTIDDVPLAFNSNAFRCIISFNSCSHTSDQAILTVSPLTVVTRPGEERELISVWPNPVTDVLHYKLNYPGSYKLHLINMTGEVIFEVIPNSFTGQMFLEELSPGLYFLQLTDAEAKRQTQKLIKR